MDGRWAMPPEPEIKPAGFYKYCIDRSIQEGRNIAMRWLIEFVGIANTDTKTGNPQPPGPPPSKNAAEPVTIGRFNGGLLFDAGNNRIAAVKLSKVWKGCTQASSHPTTRSNHPPIEANELAEALGIVIAHLKKPSMPRADTICMR